ncbi:MAG: DUF4332 domain-containing protein [Calditrichaeota bacterium]|nr:MAG: DUF4332 domain-containing protein [Calditrichota bacterium]
MPNIKTIEGIGPSYAEKLENCEIKTTDALLEKGASTSGRKEIAEKSGINEKIILKWVNMCDLLRVKGVGEEYSELLEAAGVDTVPELAQRNPENLQQAMASLNDEKKLVRKVPVVSVVETWVSHAKELPKIIKH